MPKHRVIKRAEHAIDDLTEQEHGRPYATHPGAPRSDAELRAEQRAELEHAWLAPIMTRGMTQGLVAGGAIGALIGAIVCLPLAALPLGISLGWRFAVVAIAGALAGGTAGAIYFGGRVPELKGETAESDSTPGVGTTPRDPRTDPRGR